MINLPLTFMLHQVRHAHPGDNHNSLWHGRIELLDIDIDGFTQLPETISLIRSAVMTIGRDLKSVDLVDTIRGAVGPTGRGGSCTLEKEAESRQITITARPEDAFRRLIFERRLAALQRQVIEQAIAWRQMPPIKAPEDSTAPWVKSLRDMEEAIDQLVAWQRESADLPKRAAD